jgi:hypothetical protein
MVTIIARIKSLERHAGPIPCAKARSALAEFAKTTLWYRSLKVEEQETE